MKIWTALMAAMAVAAAPLTAQKPAGAKPPDHMEHRFDNPEGLAKSFDDPKRDAWQMPDRVIGALGLKGSMSVADIGAGTGYFTVRLAKAAPGATVYAVDIEPKMVEHLKTRAAAEHLAHVVPVLASASSPNLPKAVDVVLIVDTYHHLPNRTTYFSGLRKSLTATGKIAIVDFRKEAPEGPPAEFRFTPKQIEDEMRQAGYKLDAAYDFLPRQHFLVFR
jgi:cyclopropane fatty-acyl-phospholipid synthase-like methyltransferase